MSHILLLYIYNSRQINEHVIILCEEMMTNVIEDTFKEITSNFQNHTNKLKLGKTKESIIWEIIEYILKCFYHQ